MEEKFSRTRSIYGQAAMDRLRNSRVAVFGLGGVGSYAFEALVRSGIGCIDIIDSDTVAVSNINRQIIADETTVGLPKIAIAKQRAKLINSDVIINEHNLFYLPETADAIDLSKYDFIIDAIDTVAAKIELIERASRMDIPIISVMGTGNKTDPTAVKITDISKTHSCPLCRVMRAELKKRSIKGLFVVWSDQSPVQPIDPEIKSNGRPSPASTAFVPAAAGLAAAAYVVNKISETEI